jgi:hypothetical protein
MDPHHIDDSTNTADPNQVAQGSDLPTINRPTAQVQRPSTLYPIDVLREHAQKVQDSQMFIPNTTDISLGPLPPAIIITTPNEEANTRMEPSRKRSRTDLRSDRDQTLHPSSDTDDNAHPIRQDVLPLWRQARTALTNYVKTRARIDFIKQQVETNNPPAWAFGIDRIPPFLAGNITMSTMPLRRDHAIQILRYSADALADRAKQEATRADALVGTIERIYKEDTEGYKTACDLLNSLIAKERTDIRVSLNLRAENTTALENSTIATALTTHQIPATRVQPPTVNQDFRTGPNRREATNPRGGPRSNARRQRTLREPRRQTSTSPRRQRTFDQPRRQTRSPRRGQPNNRSPSGPRQYNLTSREEALIRAFRR